MLEWITDSARQLSSAEEADYTSKYKAGDKDAGVVLLRSQGAWIIKRVSGFGRPSSVDLEDVVGELVLVLLRALKRFDPSRSALSTFVTRVIDRRTPRIIHKLTGISGGGDVDDILDSIETRETVNENSQDTEEMHQIILEICDTYLSPASKKVLLDHMAGKTLAECADFLNGKAMESSSNISRIHAPPSVLHVIDGAIQIIQDELRARGLLKDGKEFQMRLFLG